MDQLFSIFQLTEDRAKEIAAMPDEPHVHDYEELIIGIEGSMEHFIDFQTQEINAPYISYVTKGKVHRVIPKLKDGKCKAWVIRFKSEFIPETTFQLYSYYHGNANVVLHSDSCFERINTVCGLMSNEIQSPEIDYAVVRNLLNTLFSMIEAERKRVTPVDNNNPKTQTITFKNFLKILEENYKRPLGVDFYAEKLFMSSRNLNIICQNILQQSVSEIIETRKLIEAKNLLISTNKTVSEISFDLGYNERSYFTNVFKKKTNQTPGDFRKEMSKIVS